MKRGDYKGQETITINFSEYKELGTQIKEIVKKSENVKVESTEELLGFISGLVHISITEISDDDKLAILQLTLMNISETITTRT